MLHTSTVVQKCVYRQMDMKVLLINSHKLESENCTREMQLTNVNKPLLFYNYTLACQEIIKYP